MTVKTVTTLQAEWLVEPFTKSVVAALGDNNVKFVGGAVRDTLLRKPAADIDAATVHKPEEVMALLKAANIKVVPTGLKHGTVTAVEGAKTIEITTLRVDVETDGRHAEVAFTTDWLEDAKRRDFTFNALYSAPDGSLYDPFDGLADLRAGLVRFIGNAKDRIEEDALRILRFFRFFGRYGKGSPDAEALAACGEKKQMLGRLSIERVRDELLKIVALPDPLPVVKLMASCGILQEIYGPEFCEAQLEAFLQSEKTSEVDRLPYLPLLRFYILAPASLGAAGVSKTFRLSNEDRRFLLKFEDMRARGCPDTIQQIHEAIYLFGAQTVRARAIGCDRDEFSQISTECEAWQVPVMPVNGQDLLAVGWEPGPEMGKCLKQLEQLWIESDFNLDRKELLATLKS